MKRALPFLLLILATGCDKSAEENCGSAGFIPNFSRVFYKTRDFGGGRVGIEITYRDGSKSIKGYLNASHPSGSVNCNSTSGIVRVNLSIGSSATWRAFDASGREWGGAIPASCEANSCETIELK